MASSRLTPRPTVPVLVHAAMLGSLVVPTLGCGGDDGTGDSANSTDVAPTAGPCAHADGSQLPECASSGVMDDDGGETSASTGSMTATSTPTTTDQAPTAGPCVHADGSQLPECQEDDSGTGADTGSGSGSDDGASESGSGTTGTTGG